MRAAVLALCVLASGCATLPRSWALALDRRDQTLATSGIFPSVPRVADDPATLALRVATDTRIQLTLSASGEATSSPLDDHTSARLAEELAASDAMERTGRHLYVGAGIAIVHGVVFTALGAALHADEPSLGFHFYSFLSDPFVGVGVGCAALGLVLFVIAAAFDRDADAVRGRLPSLRLDVDQTAAHVALAGTF